LLLKDGALVKTVKFRDPGYIGDPINAIRIYNEKEVDELILLDITATLENRQPPFKELSEIANECFMPVTYGGGIRRLEDIKEIFNLGIEKVALNSYAVENPTFIRQAADKFGTQSIVVSIDVKKKFLGCYEVYTHGGRKGTGLDPVKFASQVEKLGAGEILLTSIDRDGTQEGYDLELIKKVTSTVSVPVIACGGAGKIEDFGAAVKVGGASACAVGSMVVYFGRHRAVLINFPARSELTQVLTLEVS
jgi:cyclase